MNKFEEQIIICKECLKGISQKINNNGVPSNNINYQNLYNELYKLSELLPTHLAIYQKRLHDFILPNLKVRDMVSYNQWGQQIIFPCTGGKSSVSCPLKPSDSTPLKHSTMPP